MGAVYFAGTIYWIPDVLVTFGGVSRVIAIPVAGLLIAYLALFPGLASWITGRALAWHGPMALWAAPFAWVAAEWLRGWLLTGFPWVLLGSSQAPWLPIAQTASLAGVWGLSALIVACNVALATLARNPRAAWPRAAFLAAMVIGLAAWGARRLASDPAPAGPTLRVAIVQGNVAQDQKWSPEFASDIFSRYLRLSRDAAARGATLIVWPESAVPFFFEQDPGGTTAIRALARETGAWFLFGSNHVEGDSPPRYYNAAFLVDPQGRTAGIYRKQHLVPFGEYVPLGRLLFFAAPLVEAVADFSAGTEAGPLLVDGHPVSTAICYEVVFGGLVRESVLGGSRLLTTLTNDAWYGRSSAPWQHFDQASMRAIELGRYLVRAANTGVSGVVDPHGRVRAELGLFETGILVDEVRLLDARTPYATIGDSFAWACAGLSLLALLARRRTGWPAPDRRSTG
jgi:apolipoprotein N-acyltransferase